jgi:hypothetical protein
MQAGGVYAVALPGRSWAIVEDMAQMAAAAAAPDLDPVHAIAEILQRLNRSRFHIGERGPAAARIELRLRGESHLPTSSTAEGSILIQVPILPREGAFRAGCTQNVILLRR